MQFTVRPGIVAGVLGGFVTFLTAADIAVLWAKFRLHHDYLFGLTPFFDFNREGNLPAFYSACALLFASALFFVIAADVRRCREAWHRHWFGLGLIFLFLAVDEAAEVHGLLTEPAHLLLRTSGPLLFAWVVPYAALTVVFAASYLRFVTSAPAALRRSLWVAGVTYVGGALGMELAGGAIVSSHGGVEGGGLDYWAHGVVYTIEEALEMAGIVILIYALVQHMAARGIEVSVRAAAD